MPRGARSHPVLADPPDGIVTFRNITVACDGVPDCRINWAAKVEDDNCNMRAHIGESNISITWDTSAPSKYDNVSYEELHARNGARGWGARMARAMVEVP